jgi:hypothetical protein
MLLEKQPKEFLEFNPGPEIGDAQAADGAMTSHWKNCGENFFSHLGNMHIFGKPYISVIRKFIN